DVRDEVELVLVVGERDVDVLELVLVVVECEVDVELVVEVDVEPDVEDELLDDVELDVLVVDVVGLPGPPLPAHTGEHASSTKAHALPRRIFPPGRLILRIRLLHTCESRLCDGARDVPRRTELLSGKPVSSSST